jgi:hypothetical protein
VKSLLLHIRGNSIAYAALFIALGGTSYAAGTSLLPANSVGTKQVINRSLLGKDFKAGQLPKGAKGAPGLTGSQGPPGIQGPQGLQGPAGSPDTSAQVLDKIKSVDGVGSGLDADLLDGMSSTHFYPAGSKVVDSSHADSADNVNCSGCITEGKLAPAEPWHEVSSFAFSRWANQGGLYETTAYYKDPYGTVHFKGLVKALVTIGTCTVIFYLPSGYKPAATSVFSVPKNISGTGTIEVDQSGQVAACTGAAVNDTYSLDPITYRANS